MQQNASAAKAATTGPCWGAYRSPSDPIAGFKREREGGRMGGEGKGRRGVETEKGMGVGIAISRWE